MPTERSTERSAMSRLRASEHSFHRTIGMSDDEVDQMIQQFADGDAESRKTWTRLLVEKYLSHRKWYFPRAGDPSAPSLSKAYAYFEHITLPRHFAGENVADQVLRRAEPGESTEETELYNPFTTSTASFIEWGIGVDLYFSSLRALGVLLLLAGIMNLPAMRYYASSDYSLNKQDSLNSTTLIGSAICTTVEWVVCEDCRPEKFEEDDNERERYAEASDGTVLVLKNDCAGVAYETVITHWVSLMFITVVMILLSLYWRAREVRFDEDKITTTDYSIVVKNPPPDAYDPDEWNAFFDQFSKKQVTCVTIALNNDLMVRKLIARREARHILQMQLPKGIDMDDQDLVRALVAQLVRDQEAEPKGCIGSILTCVTPILNIFGMMLPPDKLADKVFRLTEEIKELQNKEYEVVKVYVTFESEEGQRAALQGLSVGKLDAMMNNDASLGAVFKDRVLKIEEPCEPDAVRWLDLGAGTLRRIVFRFINFLITCGIVILAIIVVGRVREAASPTIAAYLVTILNSTVPQILKILMMFERHSTEGGFQTSLYLKITLFRWLNTAILTKIITPITGTLTKTNQSILTTINSILWSELWLTPLLRLSDWMTNAKKHLLAPRARTQDQMNHFFQGTYYNLGERYTDLTKILFLIFVYSALFPAAFFFGAAILLIQYFADKYCLMRIWGRIPTIGSELPKFSRRYFFTGSVLALCILGAYSYAQFPYDNLCLLNENSTIADGDRFFTDINQTLVKDSKLFNETVKNPRNYVFCPQSWREVDGFSFPPTPRNMQPSDRSWMGSETSESLVALYGWTSLVFVIVFFGVLFGGSSVLFFMSFFKGTYQADGQNQRVDFSSLPEKAAYVPQFKLINRPFPYLACNIDQVDQDLVGWNDPSRSYDYYNLIFDVPYAGMPRKKRIEANTRNTNQIEDQSEYIINSSYRAGSTPSTRSSSKPIFSIIKHYPPPWQQAIFDQQKEVKKQE